MGGVLGRLRTVVLGNKSHVNLANFFVSIDRPRQRWKCMRIESWSVCKPWTARFDFVSSEMFTGSLDDLHAEQVHDLSTADPFQS